jgi:hypothetical protein
MTIYNLVEAKFDDMFQNIEFNDVLKILMEVVWPYSSLFGIVLSIEFCNVFRGGSYIRLTFLSFLY